MVPGGTPSTRTRHACSKRRTELQEGKQQLKQQLKQAVLEEGSEAQLKDDGEGVGGNQVVDAIEGGS